VVDNLGMKNTKKRIRVRPAFIPFRRGRHPVIRPQFAGGIPIEMGGRRIVAMTLAQEMADIASAPADVRQQLVDAALSVGQWLADEGHPGQWDMVKPAEILRRLDFLPQEEQEQFLLAFAGLLGHGALTGQISHHSAKRSLEEISSLTDAEPLRTMARTTAAQLQSRAPS
jgi:hypothetical protein